ncbi:hypothetical protein [Halalkalirubrum salinum]|uniref:hypothetical protein n=1 Tax=Halalkalirubrum salinum TaxID=2563889 RepID=UPI0010FB74B6|nr:hypothetical protein [Halalkalirubrum salinum]
MTIVLGGFIGLAIVFTAAMFWLLVQAMDDACEQTADANEALSASFDAAALQAAVEPADNGDNGDNEIPPVAWGEPLRDNEGGQSTVVAGSTAATTITN